MWPKIRNIAFIFDEEMAGVRFRQVASSVAVPLLVAALVLVVDPDASSAQLPRPGSEPSLLAHALLEKTIFKVDIIALELWLGPETARDARRMRAEGPVPSATDVFVPAVADSRDAWVQMVFRRDVTLDRFLAGVTADMHRALRAGLLDAKGFAQVSAGLPVWLAPLREHGIGAGDRFTYRIEGDTLRTVVEQKGEVVIDQTDIGPAHRRALLGSFVAPEAGFRDDLLADLQRNVGQQ